METIERLTHPKCGCKARIVCYEERDRTLYATISPEGVIRRLSYARAKQVLKDWGYVDDSGQDTV